MPLKNPVLSIIIFTSSSTDYTFKVIKIVLSFNPEMFHVHATPVWVVLVHMFLERSVLEKQVTIWTLVLPRFLVLLPHVPPHLLLPLNGFQADQANMAIVTLLNLSCH